MKYLEGFEKMDIPGICFVIDESMGIAEPILNNHGIIPHIQISLRLFLEKTRPKNDRIIPPIPIYAHNSQVKS
ncbi:hypothetical protein ACFL1Z_00200 [Thermodesulfobacteriota bacterium]